MNQSWVSTKYSAIAHELDTINPSVVLCEFIDVSVIHPLRHHVRLTIFRIYTEDKICAEQRYDVRVL